MTQQEKRIRALEIYLKLRGGFTLETCHHCAGVFWMTEETGDQLASRCVSEHNRRDRLQIMKDIIHATTVGISPKKQVDWMDTHVKRGKRS